MNCFLDACTDGMPLLEEFHWQPQSTGFILLHCQDKSLHFRMALIFSGHMAAVCFIEGENQQKESPYSAKASTEGSAA